jgi:EmrB/QacA subfamily drug resistance transporter
LLPGGSLGDHYGRKKVYMIGIAVFTVASVLCGITPSPEFLIGARALQGIGGALMIPGSLAIIAAYFDDDTRGKAIGIWSSFTTMTSVAGPLLGGFLAESGLWRAIFFINIPLALLSVVALIRHVPESYDEHAPGQLDYIGALLVACGLAGITFGAISIGEVGIEGFRRADLMGSLLGGIFLMIVFIAWEDHTDTPMLPLKFFKSSTFTGANLLTLFLYGALGAATLFLPLNLVQVQGYGETVAGLALLPFSILLIVLSPRMGDWVDEHGPRLPLVAGPLIVALSFVALAVPGITSGPGAYWWTFLPGSVLLGLGMGMVVAPLTTSVMGSVPQSSSGIASGVNNAMSRSSQVLATAILGGIALIIFSSALQSSLDTLSLPDAARQQLIQNADDLGNTAIPDTLDESTTDDVQEAIHRAFVDMFRVVMILSAVLCVISSLMAAATIKKELKPPPALRKEKDPVDIPAG